MTSKTRSRLEERVVRVAEQALAEQRYVAPIDVLLGLGWLPPSRVDAWRQGRIEHLESTIDTNPSKVSHAMELLDAWARQQQLTPSDTDYVARTRDRGALRFSASGDPDVERAYRTHWLSPELSESARQRLTERRSRPPDLVVISPHGEFVCAQCEGTSPWLLMEDAGPLCMSCADLDHLVFLPKGDAALTRRAKKASDLAAVVVRFARARRRYERQGILVEEPALEQAEAQCFEDAEARSRRRERDRARRADEDVGLQHRLAAEIRRRFPRCPGPRAEAIARHASLRGSGRVGRTAAGRDLDPDAVLAAVTASVRHVDTPYDVLLMSGLPRDEARQAVAGEVADLLRRWRAGRP